VRRTVSAIKQRARAPQTYVTEDQRPMFSEG